MISAWALRQEELLSDCIVPPDVFNHMVDRLCDFVVPYPHALETEAGKRHLRLYLAGLLSHLDRKNAEQIAALVDVERLDAPLPAYQERGRRPKVPWQSVSAWRKSLSSGGWTRLTVRDGEKGPVGIELVRRRVQTRLERKRTGPEEWLVVTRRPLSDAGTLEGQASRDASDQDGRYGYRSYVTPTCVSEGELEEASLAELARVIKADLCIEASCKRGKGEAGMDAYQARTWQGWHHHMVLTLIAVWFLIGETHWGQQLTPALTLPQVRYGLSVLLLEVFCTPSIDYICRQVYRQLMRNELARFYHHRARKCIPPKKLRRTIQ